MKKDFDVVAEIIAYEDGYGGMLEVEKENRMIDLFQYLVDTGMAWELQGSYGRTAEALIEEGLVTKKERKT